jgi:selenocysteine-specific elongation factor
MQSERERIVKTVREFHRQAPLLPGIPRQELRGGTPAFVLDALLAETKEIVAEGELVRSRGHKLVLKEDEEQARAKIERAFEETGLAVPAMAEVLAKSGVEAARARSLLQILLREKRLVRVSDELDARRRCSLRELLARHGNAFARRSSRVDRNLTHRDPSLNSDRERITRREATSASSSTVTLARHFPIGPA